MALSKNLTHLTKRYSSKLTPVITPAKNVPNMGIMGNRVAIALILGSIFLINPWGKVQASCRTSLSKTEENPISSHGVVHDAALALLKREDWLVFREGSILPLGRRFDILSRTLGELYRITGDQFYFVRLNAFVRR